METCARQTLGLDLEALGGQLQIEKMLLQRTRYVLGSKLLSGGQQSLHSKPQSGIG